MSTQKSSTGWIVTFAATGINLILGLLYSWSVIAAELIEKWDWTNTQAALPYTVCVALLSFMTIFGGRLQDKYGPRIIALIGGSLFGLGILLSAFATTPALMVGTFGIISGVGMGFGYASATPSAIKWFEPRKKGLIAGIVVAGIGLSSVYMAPLATRLLRLYSIESTFVILGIIAIVALVSFALILKNPPAGFVPKAKAGRPVVANAEDMPWNQMVKTPAFALLWLTYLLSATAGLMLIGHIVRIVRVQTDSTEGFYIVMVMAIFNTLGRVIGGYLSDSMGRTTALLIVFLIQAGVMFSFSFLDTIFLIGAGIAVAGLAYGALFSLYPATTADFFGLKNLGVNYGLIFTSWGVAGIIGPILAGRVVDLTGTYTWSYIVAGSMLLLGALLIKFVKAPAAK
ncbi:L-lactate MFS transporter [Alkalitalea saponilacus]|uniref:MFS transporter, OFA family, oxalate/formate antiporter n=1 Tax=Alkalitalea saponilacus TaxID=889453 RepID=A0A1T5HNR5_9BACT|nr:OFA family MFS transporter [Alkalitalea saponilacus]ASB49318.1 oxalate:formate antiporter [Alkalitalea saponilacus]SKC22323.1 MFS transporter, OFA family, oxalate/formate antiporter [Alkalitalea saponilacus]